MKKRLLAAVMSFILTGTPMIGVKAQSTSYVQQNKAIMIQHAAKSISVAMMDAHTMSELTEDNKQPLEEQKAGIYDKDGKIVSVTVPNVLLKKSQIENPKANSYQVIVPADYKKDAVIPVKVKTKGALLVGATDLINVDNVSVFVYKDAKCTSNSLVSVSDNTAYLTSGGTYYVKIPGYHFSKEQESRYRVDLAFISGADTELKNKTMVISAITDYKAPVFYKMVVKKPTKVIASISAKYSSNVTLCNSKKNPITKEKYVYSQEDQLVYAVPKGTYYLKVKGNKGIMVATATYLAVSDGSGPSKEKAGTLKVNGSKKNIVICPGDKTGSVHYLKFYNPKRQTVKLYLKSSYTSGETQLEFYDSKGSKYGTRTLYDGIGRQNVFEVYTYSYTSNSKKLPKGTYYIKIKKMDKKTSGTIEVNVKNK